MAAIIHLHWCLTSLLFVLPAVSSLTVEGLKGGSITLPCNSSSGEDLTTVLIFGSKVVYGLNQHEHFRGRVHKSGSCDLILQDLKTTDAGKYTADVYDNNGLISSNTFDVHVKVNLTGRTGEELMFDLPHEAKSVEHFTDTSRTEVWRRGQGVLTDRLTNNNNRLTIENFSSSDAGTYRALNSSGGILVTVTVTESSTSSKDKHEDEPHDSEPVHVWVWIGIGIGIGVVGLVGLIVFAVIKIHQHLNKKHDSYQDVPMEEPEEVPTEEPDEVPTEEPDEVPTEEPDEVPTKEPDEVPTEEPEEVPTEEPDEVPTEEPEEVPTEEPEEVPTKEPEEGPNNRSQ